MKRIVITAAALVAFAAPAGTAAATTSKADKQEAKKECRALRGTIKAEREAFRAEFSSFGACVHKKASEAKAERKEARRNAAQECRDERSKGPEAFREKYGTNHNKKNAFGKCVSQKAKAKLHKQDKEDAAAAEEFKNAAKECDDERGDTAQSRKAFAEKYGTNHNKNNAFGKCVAQKAHDQGGEGNQDDGS